MGSKRGSRDNPPNDQRDDDSHGHGTRDQRVYEIPLARGHWLPPVTAAAFMRGPSSTAVHKSVSEESTRANGHRPGQ